MPDPTMTNSSTVSPDDPCAICGTTRENHGDRKHKFSIDGSLNPLDPPAPRRQAPTPAGQALAKDPTTAMTLRLVEVLIQKGVLLGDDLIHIFGGEKAESH